MRTWTCALLAPAFVLLCAQNAAAAPLLELSGSVSLADGEAPAGSTVLLQLDLDGNRKFAKFETVTAKVGSSGRYSLAYELDVRKIDLEFLSFARGLLADFSADGFDALLKRGALPAMITIERPGYSTITRRLDTLLSSLTLDAVLTPLAEIRCGDDACSTPNGSVQLEGFAPGARIARAFAQAYDPTLDGDLFPGSFSDSDGNLLISSGFAEINLFDDKDRPVEEVAEPVAVRFVMERESWPTLPDLEPDSGKVELPMYAFNRESGEWDREGDGELQHQDGSPVPERAVDAIRAGRYAQDVYVAFETRHFSTFNCDAPRMQRACVKGRLVNAAGEALAGLSVSAEGFNYTGSGGTMVTGASGYFAADVLRSEPAGQDLDFNRVKGETFQARVRASAMGTFLGEPFATPSREGAVLTFGVTTRALCKPEDCACLDLGDIEVDLEVPRQCEVKVRVTFSGAEVAGEPSSLGAGEALASASVYAHLVGSGYTSEEVLPEVCRKGFCGTARADADGWATLTVPVTGPAPRIRVVGDLHQREGEMLHSYSGALTVEGCGREVATIEAEAELSLAHSQQEDLASFLREADKKWDKPLFDCGCVIAPPRSADRGATACALAGLLALVLGWRRRSR